METSSDYYILESKVEYLQFENSKLKKEIQSLKKLINHMLEGKKLPSDFKKTIDIWSYCVMIKVRRANMKKTGEIDYDALLRQIGGGTRSYSAVSNSPNFTYVQYDYNDLVRKMNDKLSGNTSDDQFFQELENIGNQTVSLPKEKKVKKLKKKVVKKKEEKLDINGMGNNLIALLNRETNEIAQDVSSVAPQVMQVLNLVSSESQNTKLLENMNTTLSDISFRQFKELVNKSKG